MKMQSCIKICLPAKNYLREEPPRKVREEIGIELNVYSANATHMRTHCLCIH